MRKIIKKQQDSTEKMQAGFTMVEVAVVLLVVSIMTSGLVIGIPQYIHNGKTEVTARKMELVTNALSAYAQRHYRLPCPADTNAAARGQERINCFANNVNTETLHTSTQGVVPWRELGLSEKDVTDGWGRYITYKPAPHLTVNTYNLAMQEDSAAPDALFQRPDVHNACRNQTWFNEGRNHLNRQKALFCCNSHPKQDYLTVSNAAVNDVNLIATSPNVNSWRDFAVTVAGVDNDDSLNGDNVVSTNAWIDAYDTPDSTGNLVFAGTFEDVFDEDADASLLRASGHAVTLISHGGNGSFSFLRNADQTSRRNATMNVGAAPTTAVIQSATADERKNVWPPDVFAATIGHSKTGAHDKSSLRDGFSDDVVHVLRSDQLFAKAGGGATCVRPTGGDYTCPAFSYANFVYVLDTSKSMTDAGLGGTRYDVALETLKNTTDPDDPIDSVDSLLARHIASEGKNDDDPDVVGFTGLAYATEPEAIAIFSEVTETINQQMSALQTDYYGVTGQSCNTHTKYENVGPVTCKNVTNTTYVAPYTCVPVPKYKWIPNPACGPSSEGCQPTIQVQDGTTQKCTGTKQTTTTQVCGPSSVATGTYQTCNNVYGWSDTAAQTEYNELNTLKSELYIVADQAYGQKDVLISLNPASVFLNYDLSNNTVQTLTDVWNQSSSIKKAGDKLTPYEYDANGDPVYQTDAAGNPLLDASGNPIQKPSETYLKPDDERTALYHTLIESAKLLGEEKTITDPYDPNLTKTITQYGTLNEPASIMMISDGVDTFHTLFGDPGKDSLSTQKSKMYNTLKDKGLYNHLIEAPAADNPAYDQVTAGRMSAIQKYYASLEVGTDITAAKHADVFTKLAAGTYNDSLYQSFVTDLRSDGSISAEAFFGYVMAANYPFMRINIIDVACTAPDINGNDNCNRSLQDIAELTNGAYLPTIDPNALEAYLRQLSACLGDA